MENKEEKQQLPEAPASVTVKVKSPAGYEYLFTMRDESTKNLLFKMTAMEKHFISQGFQPIAQGNGFPKREEKPKKECSIHHVQMTEKVSKKDGSKYFSHSKGKYPDFGEWCNGTGYPSEMNQNRTEEYGEYYS